MKKRMALFTPGPTNLHPLVLATFQQPILHHRGPMFRTLYPKLCQQLKSIFQTTIGETLILTGSGTLGLDAGMVSLLQPGEQVLVVSNGYFGERLIQMAQQQGFDVIAYQAPWTTAIDPKQVQAILQEYPDIKALLAVHCETSTGQIQDIQALGECAKAANVLFIVDAISGLLFHDFYFDAWHVDYAVSSSQKGFGLPPGLAFVCMSQRARNQLKDQGLPYYLSLKDNLAFLHQYGTTPSTPAVLMIQACEPIFNHLLSLPYPPYQARGQKHVEHLQKSLTKFGLTPLIQDKKQQANGVVGFYLPPTIRPSQLQEFLQQHYQVLIEKGIDTMASNVIRIGVMSDLKESEISRLIQGIKAFLTSTDFK